MTRRDNQLISIYKFVFAYCFFDVFCLGDNTFQVLVTESIIDP